MLQKHRQLSVVLDTLNESREPLRLDFVFEQNELRQQVTLNTGVFRLFHWCLSANSFSFIFAASETYLNTFIFCFTSLLYVLRGVYRCHLV